MNAPQVSIVIVNWNATEHLRECLESIAGNVNIPVEIIVVDNASDDASPDELDSIVHALPNARLILNPVNMGYARANNQGLKMARAPYVLLLNPDTRIHTGCLEKLVAFLNEHPDATAVAPKLHYPDGTLQRSCRTFPTWDVVLFSALGLDKLFPHSRTFGRYKMTWWNYNDVRIVEQPMASALLIRRTALDEIGGFDEQFPVFFNDVDMCYRLFKSNRRIYYLPHAIVTHYHGASTQLLGARLVWESHISLLRFYSKHFRNLYPIWTYALARGIVMLTGALRYLAVQLRRMIEK